jgi:hypothetical protein
MGYGKYTLASGKVAGYMVEATCEHPGCTEEVDRGMAHACGGEPGEQGGWSCEGYFCAKHLFCVGVMPDTAAAVELRESVSLCAQCTSQAAFMDQIEDAEHYRTDSTFAPNEETLSVLRAEGCAHVAST